MEFIITKFFKVWGVKYETELPPEFIITKHAEQRLLERFKCSKEKINKIVIKAWYSKDVEIPKLNKVNYRKENFNNKKYKVFYRELMGYVFVFDIRTKRSVLPPQKILITVYN